MLKEEQSKILAILKDNKDKGGYGMTTGDLANHLGDIPLSELEYYLDALSRDQYIVGEPTMAESIKCYQITPKGTGHLLGDSE